MTTTTGKKSEFAYDFCVTSREKALSRICPIHGWDKVNFDKTTSKPQPHQLSLSHAHAYSFNIAGNKISPTPLHRIHVLD